MVKLTKHDWRKAPVHPAPGTREFAIGDVHGQREMLETLLEIHARKAPDAHLTLLGDLIDRGPDSAGALRLGLETVAKLGPERATFLPGNHELLMLATLLDPQSKAGAAFGANGGMWLPWFWDMEPTTAEAAMTDLLGADPLSVLTGGKKLADVATKLRMHRRAGNLVLVHAGIDPKEDDLISWFEKHERAPLSMNKQGPAWIRQPFLDWCDTKIPEAGVFTVHGHTIERGIGGKTGPRPIHAWRLCLDAGSYHEGAVAAALIEDGRIRTFVVN
jgi:serine/threonine protein phosphatase 1